MNKPIVNSFTINISKNRQKPKTDKPTIISRLCLAEVIIENNRFKAKINLLKEKEEYIIILPFTLQSRDLKNKKYIFSKYKDKLGKQICIIRDEIKSNINPNVNSQYTALKEKIVIAGNIVKINGEMYFDYKSFVSFSKDIAPNEYVKIDISKPLLNDKQ